MLEDTLKALNGLVARKWRLSNKVELTAEEGRELKALPARLKQAQEGLHGGDPE